MLYETAARAEEILTLDIEDLGPAFRCTRVTSKGGAIEYVHWATATARLLPPTTELVPTPAPGKSPNRMPSPAVVRLLKGRD